MGATSITGKGPGESFGLHKPENSNGCCGGKAPESVARTPLKRVCSAKLKIGGSVSYKTGNFAVYKGC